MSNRIAKHVYKNQIGMLESTTYYIRDAQGNVPKGTLSEGITTSLAFKGKMLAFTSIVYSEKYKKTVKTSRFSFSNYLITGYMNIGTSEGGNPKIQNWINNLNKDYGYEDKKNKPIYNDAGEWCGAFVYQMLKENGAKLEKNGSWETPAYSMFYTQNWKGSTKLKKNTNGVYGVDKYISPFGK